MDRQFGQFLDRLLADPKETGARRKSRNAQRLLEHKSSDNDARRDTHRSGCSAVIVGRKACWSE